MLLGPMKLSTWWNSEGSFQHDENTERHKVGNSYVDLKIVFKKFLKWQSHFHFEDIEFEIVLRRFWNDSYFC